LSSKVIVLLEDDVDGGKADETVEFGLDGVAYVIDLSGDNAKKLRGALDGYVSKGRKVSGRTRKTSKSYSDVETSAVRAWAASNGIKVSERGRIAADVVAQFKAAGN
jgi:Lsr2